MKRKIQMKQWMIGILLLLLSGCQKPTPVHVFVALDTSASFGQQRTGAIEQIRHLVGALDPGQDNLHIMRFDHTGVRLLYEGRPALPQLDTLFANYGTTASAQEKGTPVRDVLERIEKLDKGRTTIAIYTDGADEGGSLTATYVQLLLKEIRQKGTILALLGVDPRWERNYDPFRLAMGERFIMTNAVQEQAGKGTQHLLEMIQR